MADWPKRDVRPLPEPKKDYENLKLESTLVSVRGPCEAVFLARLWDLMLCQSNRQRLIRANARSTNWVPPYSRPTDKLIRGLFEKTEALIRPDLFVRLWAPMTDPETGQLKTDMGSVLNHVTKTRGVRVPFTAEELWMILMTPERARFVENIRGGRRARRNSFTPNRQIGSLPGLRIQFSKDPIVHILDPQGRIHCPHGPAVVYGDGTPEFYWRGTRVPSTFIPITDHWLEQYPDVELIPLVRPYRKMTAQEALGIVNVETRRAACEIVGWHNILQDLHAIVVDRDPDPTIGELLRVFLTAGEWQEPIVQQFLRVRCGTGRTFALMVPDTCSTALEANAWTYGLSPTEYKPEIRT